MMRTIIRERLYEALGESGRVTLKRSRHVMIHIMALAPELRAIVVTTPRTKFRPVRTDVTDIDWESVAERVLKGICGCRFRGADAS